MKQGPSRLRTLDFGPIKWAVGLLVVVLGGLLLLDRFLGPEATEEEQSGRSIPAGVTLRLAVVEDPGLASAIEGLRGEWNAQTGSEFQVQQLQADELADAERSQIDVLISASHQLGTLAEDDRIVPVPPQLLEDYQASWSDVFDLVRSREAAWDGKAYAVPLGSPVLTCFYRADLLEKLGRRPPKTWDEYGRLAELLADRETLVDRGPADGSPWFGAVEPLGPDWAGTVLLARAAAYATHRENYSTLFNIDTMEPLIGGPPFVRALEELVEVARLGSPDQLGYDPADARAAFFGGRCGLALSWPTAADRGSDPPETAVAVGFAELPGSMDVYNVGDGQWQTRRDDEDPHVPLLASAGRLGTVTRECRFPEAAFHLLFWLSDERWSRQVSVRSPATTLFRRSHTQSPQVWVGSQVAASTAAEYALLTQQTLGREQGMFALRIPGRWEYLAALDEAVQQAVGDGQPPEECLAEAADRWRQITRRLGHDRQRQAYCRSLGLD